ncbi:MAG: OsmC family protein [Acidobacteriota bacterium]|nr:OsmC family protein [Acidobacteriota bacterium]
MSKEHIYKVQVVWAGNEGEGTKSYTAYSQAHEISREGKEIILGSADPIYCGGASRYNLKELIVAAHAGCHMLRYLHLCADAGVVVVDYTDEASGKLIVAADGNGKITEVTINPRVTVTSKSDAELAKELHDKAHEFCFIANSMNFPVMFNPEILVEKQKAV